MSSVYFPFKRTGESFSDRVGSAMEFTSALGHVVVSFGWLENSVVRHIGKLAALSEAQTSILTAEVSFKAKVHALSSLVRDLASTRRFNVGREDTLEVWDDIVRMLFTCEDLRNRILHSTYHSAGLDPRRRVRRKTTAKASRGLRREEEETSSDYMLDVYDHGLCVLCALDEFFYE